MSSIETVLCRYEHWKNNIIEQTEVEEFCLKLYTVIEIEELLHHCGFQVLKRLVPYTTQPPDEQAAVVLFECKKSNK